MKKFVVVTGGRAFIVEAKDAFDAISRLKQLIAQRAEIVQEDENPYGDEQPFEDRPAVVNEISLSLVNSLQTGELNFVVMNEFRMRLLAGERAGVYEEPPSPQLVQSLKHLIPVWLVQGNDLEEDQSHLWE